jgi:integrase
LKWWRGKFGTRSRASLESVELAAALDGLGKAASTVNKYRTALSNLYTVLDGKNAANPFRDIKREAETSAQQRRDQPYELIDAILAHVRARGRGAAPSRTRAFLLVEAYAPVTRAQLVKMGPEDVDFEAAEIRTPGRAKGHGTAPRRKPISADAIEAFRAFDAAACWGVKPSRSSIWRTFTRARDAAIKELRRTHPKLDLRRAATMRPYDLRHSFAALTFKQTGSLDVTGQMLDHLDASTTLRYASGAVDPLLKAAGTAIAAAFASRPKYTPPPVPLPRSASALKTEASGNPKEKSGLPRHVPKRKSAEAPAVRRA